MIKTGNFDKCIRHHYQVLMQDASGQSLDDLIQLGKMTAARWLVDMANESERKRPAIQDLFHDEICEMCETVTDGLIDILVSEGGTYGFLIPEGIEALTSMMILWATEELREKGAEDISVSDIYNTIIDLGRIEVIGWPSKLVWERHAKNEN